ncbi:MAG: ArsA family ATPase [Acidimicrobiales bacterium]
MIRRSFDARIDRLVAASDIVVVCGAGGVGKTSMAAAGAATAAVELEAKVLVVTVDPARRLGGALGLEAAGVGAEQDRQPLDADSRAQVGHREHRIPAADLAAAAGAQPRGELWVAMLDTRAGWDDVVTRHAPDAAARRAILANPLYRNLTGTFTQSHDYMAMERLHEVHVSGRYDLIVVDTPPSRHAIDFLDAPDRMAEFFSSRLLRWLTGPSRSRLAGMASKPFSLVADRLLGASFLADIAEFFLLFQSMYGGFVERARAVQQTLRDPRTAFVVVTTLEPATVAEAQFFCDALTRRDLVLGAVICNRALPAALDDALARAVATELQRHPQLDRLEELGLDPATVTRVLAEVGRSFSDYAMMAAREGELALRLSRRSELTVLVPQLDHDVAGLADLLALGRAAWSG